jgi:hypothetical protein
MVGKDFANLRFDFDSPVVLAPVEADNMPSSANRAANARALRLFQPANSC